MTDDDQPDACEATPEELADWDRKNQEWRAFIREKVAAGYVWDEGRLALTHAKDAALSILFDPMTLEAIYSPKLAARIGEEIERAKRSSEL